MKEFSELSLFRRMVSMFLFIFSYILLITILFVLPISMDKGATLATCLSVGAMLYAAIVAYLLLDNWKTQHRDNLKSTYFQKNFNKYVELKDAIYLLQGIYESWLEDIYRNQGEVGDYDDGGLINGVAKVKIILKELISRLDYYAIIFKDDTYQKTIKEFKEKLEEILDPILDEYYEREGSVYHSEHIDDAKNLKEQLPVIIEKYDRKISDLMSKQILLK